MDKRKRTAVVIDFAPAAARMKLDREQAAGDKPGSNAASALNGSSSGPLYYEASASTA